MKAFLAVAATLIALAASPAGAIETSPDTFNSLAGGGSIIGSLNTDPDMMWNNRGVLVLDEVTPAPEPGEWAMILAGFGVVGFAARRRKV